MRSSSGGLMRRRVLGETASLPFLFDRGTVMRCEAEESGPMAVDDADGESGHGSPM